MEKPFNGILFRLNGLCCAVDAMDIREIVGKTDWKPLSVDGEPDGFIQVRGKAARVVDLREKFRFPAISKEGRNSFIAVRQSDGDGGCLAALWVDTVLDLVNIPGEDLAGRPSALNEIPAEYIRSSFPYNGETVYILKVEELLKNDIPETEPALEGKAS